MEDLELLIDLHLEQARQGPGSAEMTARAMSLAGLDDASDLRIADIGCGTGAASLQLAADYAADVTAVDFLPPFIHKLEADAAVRGLSQRIRPLVAAMEALPFSAGEFDLIWSEGAIYNIGFEAGIGAWRQFLKPGGILVVSEITWLTRERPQALQRYWEEAYPQIATAGEKIAQLQARGYDLLAYFTLPPSCWLENYYLPLEDEFPAFLSRQGNAPAAQALVDAEREEVALYRQYHEHYSYGMYIARVAA